MSLINDLKKNSTIKETSLITESKLFTEKDMVQTHIPMINVALAGSLTGGLTSGLTMVARAIQTLQDMFFSDYGKGLSRQIS